MIHSNIPIAVFRVPSAFLKIMFTLHNRLHDKYESYVFHIFNVSECGFYRISIVPNLKYIHVSIYYVLTIPINACSSQFNRSSVAGLFW